MVQIRGHSSIEHTSRGATSQFIQAKPASRIGIIQAFGLIRWITTTRRLKSNGAPSAAARSVPTWRGSVWHTARLVTGRLGTWRHTYRSGPLRVMHNRVRLVGGPSAGTCRQTTCRLPPSSTRATLYLALLVAGGRLPSLWLVESRCRVSPSVLLQSGLLCPHCWRLVPSFSKL